MQPVQYFIHLSATAWHIQRKRPCPLYRRNKKAYMSNDLSSFPFDPVRRRGKTTLACEHSVCLRQVPKKKRKIDLCSITLCPISLTKTITSHRRLECNPNGEGRITTLKDTSPPMWRCWLTDLEDGGQRSPMGETVISHPPTDNSCQSDSRFPHSSPQAWFSKVTEDSWVRTEEKRKRYVHSNTAQNCQVYATWLLSLTRTQQAPWLNGHGS